MIAFLKGRVADRQPGYAVLDVGGVGYLVNTTNEAIAAAQPGEELTLHTYMAVSDSAIDLYGFLTREECACFRRLIGVSGVGPKSALGVLNQMSVSELSLALVAEDAKAIAKSPGIGIKTAQKIILELKDKVSQGDLLGGAPRGGGAVRMEALTTPVQDAIEALTALGYPPEEAAKAVSAVKDGAATADELVRLALRRFAF